MVWAHRFMAVPAANVAVARHVAQTIAPAPSAQDLWTRACNATGSGAATHYVSSGLIDAQFAALLGDAAGTYAAYQANGGSTTTLAQIQALYAAATIRADLNYDGGAQAGLAALGLKVIDPKVGP